MSAREHIRTRRKELGLRQADLARLLQPYFSKPEWDVTTVSKMERGHRDIKADEIPILAKVLGCKREDLLDPIPE